MPVQRFTGEILRNVWREAQVRKNGEAGNNKRNVNYPTLAQPARIDWIRAKAPFGSRVSFWLEDRNSRQEGAFDDAYWM